MIVFQCEVPLYPAVGPTFQKTVDKHGYDRKQKEADKPKDDGEKEDKEVVITTHFLLGFGCDSEI
jgi:hypothetical protein